jgi:hypothetical protein
MIALSPEVQLGAMDWTSLEWWGDRSFSEMGGDDLLVGCRP